MNRNKDMKRIKKNMIYKRQKIHIQCSQNWNPTENEEEYGILKYNSSKLSQIKEVLDPTLEEETITQRKDTR